MFKIWRKLNKTKVAIICLLVFMEAALFLILPSMAADVLNSSSIQGDTATVYRIGGIMLLANLLTIVLAITSTRMSAKESQGLGNRLRKEIFAKVMAFSKKDISNFGTSTLMTRTTNDIMQIQLVTMLTLRLIILSPIIMLVSAFFAYQREPQLAWVFAITLPLIVLGIVILFKFANPLFRSIQKKTDRLNKVFREGLSGTRVIRAFNTTTYEEERFDAVNNDFRQTAIRAFTLLALILPIMFMTIGVSNVLIFMNGAQLISMGQMETGNLIAFVQYAVQVLMSIMQVSMLMFFLPRAEVSAERVNAVLDQEVSISDPDQAQSLNGKDLSVRFNDVCFGFEGADRYAVEDISFSAQPGQTVAIIGGTGAGKSTIANLITRLYDASKGSVEINGVDVREAKQADLRALIGYAPQKAILFSGTIRSNMLYGNPQANDEEIWHALEVAQADFVNDLADGLDARVEQGGNNFSGGQKQRLSIARAIVSQPDIYIFDDSFSALDFQTDAKLRAALKPETQTAITFIIAQRVNTVVDADQILVLEEGKIVGLGNHEELKADNPIYQDIIDSQMRGEDI